MFTPALFDFLTDLTANNTREWFTANKGRFEADVKRPLHAFVAALAPKLAEIDPLAVCNDKSVFRIYRDTRFSKDKAPYKTHAAAQFVRGTTRGPSGTGYYLHLEPGRCFFAGGLYMPEPAVAAKIRASIDAHPTAWAAARDVDLMDGEALVRVPKPWSAEHPYADDLRRKSFIGRVAFSDNQVVAGGFVDRVAKAAAKLGPLVHFVDDAAG